MVSHQAILPNVCPFCQWWLIFVQLLPSCSRRQPPERDQNEDLARVSPSLCNLSFMSTCACEKSIGLAIIDPKLTVSRGVRLLRVDFQLLVSRKVWCSSSLSIQSLQFVLIGLSTRFLSLPRIFFESSIFCDLFKHRKYK